MGWHHDHGSYQSQAKQERDHQRERDVWLAFAEDLLGEEFEPLKTLVFAKLATIIRTSSLVEMVNSFIRPYLNSCKGQITQEALNLIMFYHNHRRYNSGKRKGKAPIELLTGHALEAQWVELLMQQVNRQQEAPLNASPPSRPLLQPQHHLSGDTPPSAALAGQATLDTADAEALWHQPVVEAA